MTCILYKNNILILLYNIKTTKGIIVYLITNMAHDFFGKVGVTGMYDGRKRWYIILSDKSKIFPHLKRGKLFLRNIASFLIITTLSFFISSMHFCMLGRTEYSIGMYLFLRKQICSLLHSSKR